MKKKIASIFICMLVAICSAFTAVTSTSVDKHILVIQSNSSKQGGTMLITEFNGNRVIEVDSGGTIIWEKAGLNDPVDAERLANGNTLIAELGNNSVIEVDSSGNTVWNYSALIGPFDVERLANGNTLIMDTYNDRVIEVDSGGTIVWEKDGLYLSTDAERLANGNTLIAEWGNNSVIEVDSGGNIVWSYNAANGPVDAERLANGNTLITEYMYGNRVIEVDSSGNLVWEYNNNSAILFDAERLANGNTLITEFIYGNRVIEVDSSGTIVWEKTGLDFPIDVERISKPPDAPTISGPNTGKPNIEYDFTFNSVDPDGDDVRFIIDWGDGDNETTSFTTSGTNLTVSHSWSEKGTYSIIARAEDGYNALSDWTEPHLISIQKSKSIQNLFLTWLHNHPNLFPIIRQLLGL